MATQSSVLWRCLCLLSFGLLNLVSLPAAFAQGTTAFTYQGQLRDGGTNANGNYSMVFKLKDAASDGNEVGPTVTLASQFITNGQFNASLDFGDVFDGSARWLEISVEGNVLTPRTLLAPVPYALHASTATALNSSSWNASVGTFLGHDNVLGFSVEGSLVLGLASDGALINGGLGVDSIDIGPDGISISSDGQGGLQIPTSLTVSNIYSTGDTIQFASHSGATIKVNANGDFIFDDNLSINSLGSITLPAPGGAHSITANNQGIDVNGLNLSASSGVVFPTGTGGFVSVTANANGILIPGGNLTVNGPISCQSLNQTSDRAAKENFAAIDCQKVLEKVSGLPITRWNYKTETSAEHVGPMAQDFYAAFSLGSDDKHINTVDEGGIALVAIQGLNQVVKEKDAEIAALKQRLDNLEKAVSAMAQQQKGTNQ